MAGPPMLVGREAELNLARSVLRRPVGGGAVLVLGGHAGVGKTAMARALASEWPESVWIAGGLGLAEVPFGAVARLLVDVPSARETPARGREADVVALAVRTARAQPERLVVVDDAHHLDPLSAIVVQQLALDRSVPMLVTVRSGEPTHGELASLWRDGHAERLDLQALGRDEVADVIELVVGGRVDDQSLAALFARSEGNPLLLRELLRDAVEAGSLIPGVDGLHWSGDIGRGRRLKDVIARRLVGLSDADRRTLVLLALSESLDRDVLRRLGPVDLDRAEAQGLVVVDVVDGRARARLGHPLLGEAVLDRTPAAAVDATRLELAEALSVAGSGLGDVLLEARLRLQAGDRSQPMRFVHAAEVALTLGVPVEGQRLARAAVESGAPSGAGIVLAESLWLSGDAEGAVRALEELLPRLESDAERVRAALDLHLIHQANDASDRVEDVYERVRPAMVDPTWAAVLEANSIQAAMLRGETRTATERGEALLAAQDDPLVRVRLTTSVGAGWALQGRTQDALDFVAEMLPHALRLQAELPLGPAWVVAAQAQALLLAGRLEQAAALVDLVRGIDQTGYSTRELVLLYAGRLDLAVGRAAAAADKLTRYLDDLRSTVDPGGAMPWAASLCAEALALTGDLDGARALLPIAEARSHVRTYDADAMRARAWVAALGGEIRRANEMFLDLARRERTRGEHSFELQALHDAARLGAAVEVAGDVERAANAVDGEWPNPILLHVRGLRSGDGGQLEAAGEAFAAMGARLHAAEAIGEAARAYAADGVRTRAAAALRRRDELLAGLGPVRTPALLDAPRRARLTPREREVVLLASQGLSNKAIAERLVLSPRTAEGHLLRAFAKLGVTDRSQLAGALHEIA